MTSSAALFIYFISKEHNLTFTPTIIARVLCAVCKHTPLDCLAPRVWCVCVYVSSGGLKLVYKVSIRLKVDFP